MTSTPHVTSSPLDRNSLAEIIHDRYTVRQFAPGRPIPDDDLSTILRAAQQAPTARNQQPFHLYLIQSDEARAKLHECYVRPGFEHASAYVLVVGEEDKAWRYKDDLNSSVYIDAAIATSYMQLQAWELGVASVWVCAFDRLRCAELFDLDMSRRIPICILALGYPAEGFKHVPRTRKPLEELLTTL